MQHENFQGNATRGIYWNGGVRFAWDGVEVTAVEFMEKVSGLENEVEAQQAALAARDADGRMMAADIAKLEKERDAARTECQLAICRAQNTELQVREIQEMLSVRSCGCAARVREVLAGKSEKQEGAKPRCGGCGAYLIEMRCVECDGVGGPRKQFQAALDETNQQYGGMLKRLAENTTAAGEGKVGEVKQSCACKCHGYLRGDGEVIKCSCCGDKRAPPMSKSMQKRIEAQKQVRLCGCQVGGDGFTSACGCCSYTTGGANPEWRRET